MNTLQMGAQAYPFKLTTRAILNFELACKVSFVELIRKTAAEQNGLSFNHIYRLAYEALKAGGTIAQQPYTKTWEEFLDEAEGVSLGTLSGMVAQAMAAKVDDMAPETTAEGN